MEKRKLFVLTVLCAAVLSGCRKEADTRPAPGYASLKVAESGLETVEKYPATFRGRQDVEIIPQVSGKIVSVDVREGQRVRRGQTLFIIDQVPYKAALQTASANLVNRDDTGPHKALPRPGRRGSGPVENPYHRAREDAPHGASSLS